MKKFIVVTGGSKGIGKAIIIEFAREGFDIITCSRNPADLEHLKATIEAAYPTVKVHIMAANLAKKQSVEKFAGFINGITENVDVLVNNTGYFLPGQIHSEPDGTLESMMETNLYSAYNLSKLLIPGMIKHRNGYIFNICSTASITAYTNGGSYCISKFALYGMSKVLREELKEHAIRVTAVLPGATLTSSWDGVNLPPERFMKPEDVAASIFSAFKLSINSVVEEIIIRPQLGDL